MSPKTFPSGHSQPRRNRKDASHERRMRRGAQALLAAVAATTPGAVSAEEAAFNAFTQGAQLYQVQAVVPDANLPAVPETRSPSPGELGYVCIEAASQDGAVTAVVLAGKDRLAYRAFDTSTPYGQADVDELPCQTIAQFEEGIRDRTRRFVNATADYIEEHEAKAGLSSPNAPIMRRPEFTDNLDMALLRTAQNFNRLNSAILQRRGQEAFARAGAWPGADGCAATLGQAGGHRAAADSPGQGGLVSVPAPEHRRADRRPRPQRDRAAAAKRLHRHRAWSSAADSRRLQGRRRSADVHRPVARPGYGGLPAAHRRERRQDRLVHSEQRLPRSD